MEEARLVFGGFACGVPGGATPHVRPGSLSGRARADPAAEFLSSVRHRHTRALCLPQHLSLLPGPCLQRGAVLASTGPSPLGLPVLSGGVGERRAFLKARAGEPQKTEEPASTGMPGCHAQPGRGAPLKARAGEPRKREGPASTGPTLPGSAGSVECGAQSAGPLCPVPWNEDCRHSSVDAAPAGARCGVPPGAYRRKGSWGYQQDEGD